MKIAVIDMGTNTFHLLIVTVGDGDFKVLYREKVAVQIGKKGINQGYITDEAVVRAISTLKQFKSEINGQGIDHVFATATSAIRNAKNGTELVELIEKETGIQTRIISGLQEAEYIYFGVTKALSLGTEKHLIMDIGGGSIEFIIANDHEIFWKQSFEVGGQRMVEKFHESDPIVPENITALEKYLFEQLQELFEACSQHQPAVLIGSSGTFDTLSDIYQLKDKINVSEDATELPLTLEAFEAIADEIIVKTKTERLAIPGMIELRVEMIVVAVVLIRYIIESLGIKSIRVSSYALKEGVLLKTISDLDKIDV
ncbi:MAG: Ppx/GppA family phosphatase [Cyclobacteriaceae bacterium]